MTDQGSELVTRILEYIGSSALTEISWISGVKEELLRIEETLIAIQAVIFDVQEQQSTSKSVRNWLQNLKSVAYDIEDVLDLISTQDLELKVNGRSLFRKISRLFTNYEVGRELRVIRQRLDEINYNRRSFFVDEQNKTPLLVRNVVQRETYSYVRESDVMGREEDKERIVDLVISSSSCHDPDCVSVVPVVGIGGMGKTTLARMVYNDPAIVKMFDLRLWAHVSNKFVLRTLISDILQAATSLSFSHLNMEALQNMLRERLEGQTYVIILDDVWIRDPKQWIELRELLAVGSPRSRIIVTTRDESVASITGTMEPYRLQGLSNEDCWSIFAKYAFSNCEYKEFSLLAEIGKSIVRKCKGVPLAAKTLGSVLYGERDERVWKRIEESELWEIEQGPEDILPALKLSYDQTPCHLRSCFALCAFKKGYPLFRNHLISTWLALGLLQSRDGEEDVEVLGNRYSNELLSRSFFQYPRYVVTKNVITINGQVFDEWSPWKNFARMYSSDLVEKTDLGIEDLFMLDDRVVVFEMHDLLHDLAVYVSEEDTSIMSSKSKSVSQKARHVLWDHEDLSRKDFPLQVLCGSKARVFSFVHPMGLVNKSFLKGLLSSLKCLRVLNLNHAEFEELPDSIGDMKHLRYLNLSFNSKLLRLPQTTCKLVNLQTLDVFRCTELQMIPTDIHKLVSLRSIILTLKTRCLPDEGMLMLRSLENLRLYCCQNLRSLSEGIGKLQKLRYITILSCPELVSLPNEMKRLTNLVELRIFDCGNLDLNGWEGLCGLRSLKYLDFRELPKLLTFPKGLDSACGGSLQYLRIDRCYNLKTMPKRLQHCTSLLRLCLINCPSLTSLPKNMNAMRSLQVLDIVGCPTISLRCKKDIGDDWNRISHIPVIRIDHEVIQRKVAHAQQGDLQVAKSCKL